MKKYMITEQQGSNKFTQAIKTYLTNASYTASADGSYYVKSRKFQGKYNNALVNAFINNDGTYQVDSINPKKKLSTGTWYLTTPGDPNSFEWSIPTYVNQSSTSTSQPNWSKCLKNDNFYKDGDYNSSSGKFEFKEPITATATVTNPLTVVKRDLNTFDENGVWNFTDSDGDILETGKWKCLPIIGTVINNPTDNFHISIKGVWYLKTSIPIDFNSIKEVNGEIVGKYGGKDAIWNDASNEWEVTNTGSQNTGSQNNSSTNNQNTNTTNNTSTGCRKLTAKKDKDFFNYKTPNDSKYLYGQDGGEWFALNTKNDKQFNVSKCYPNVISKLNNSVIKIRTISNNNSYITTSGEKSTSGIKVRPKQTPLSNSKIEGEDSLTNSGKYVDSKIGI